MRLHDGHAVEAVRIPLPDPDDARALKQRRKAGLAAPLEALPTSKYVVCVSSQAGCALACDFCATGRLGAIRSLATWEILEQIRLVAVDAEHPVRGVVFMGMGEPFLNYDNVVRAARVLSDPAGYAISAKAITISTAGVVPMIKRYTQEGHRFRLIVSLGAPNPVDRLPLMPIEKRWPLPVLMEAVRGYVAATGERMTFAYVAIGGVNMSPQHARQLADLLHGTARQDQPDRRQRRGAGQYLPPSEAEIEAFRDVLERRGHPGGAALLGRQGDRRRVRHACPPASRAGSWWRCAGNRAFGRGADDRSRDPAALVHSRAVMPMTRKREAVTVATLERWDAGARWHGGPGHDGRWPRGRPRGGAAPACTEPADVQIWWSPEAPVAGQPFRVVAVNPAGARPAWSMRPRRKPAPIETTRRAGPPPSYAGLLTSARAGQASDRAAAGRASWSPVG